jgi:broad specificity phosphatase PhoE
MAWWYSQDEERWNGPCSSREEAISEGRGEYDAESFMVMDAETGDYDMRLDVDTITERLSERNEDRSDPDGDPPLYQITKEQGADLAAMVNAAIMRWVHKHRIDIRAWCFVKQSPHETISAETPDEESKA